MQVLKTVSLTIQLTTEEAIHLKEILSNSDLTKPVGKVTERHSVALWQQLNDLGVPDID